MDNLNPDWNLPVNVDYIFQAVQEIFLRVYHYSTGHLRSDAAKHILIGEAAVILSSLITVQSQQKILDLQNPKLRT